MARGKHIEVESGIPAPTRHHLTIFPFGELEVGNSFFAAGAKIGQVTGCAYAYSKTHRGLKFTARSVDGGVRCWRIA